MSNAPDLKLGLIGDNIAHSLSPRLHRLAGVQNGMTVQYDRLAPHEVGEDFDTLFDRCAGRGYRGVNVTYPYKRRVGKKVRIDDELIRALGAVNTVTFEPSGPVGHNTDYTGFMAAYRAVQADLEPGIACLIGTGGVGRALAFGLIAFGADEIRLVDKDEAKAQALTTELRAIPNAPRITAFADAAQAAVGATGIVNGTPVGMIGYGGSPLSQQAMATAEWAFDAVYTPRNTQFLQDAAARGIKVISGYELFIYQGVHAWSHFAGLPLDETQLRADMLKQEGVA